MTKPIKALLLAAGMGTRLRPITLKIPKCLVKIDNKCLLQIWLDKLFLIGCKEVLINTHYLHQEVENFLQNYDSKDMIITTTYEEELLGTAGTLIKNSDFFLGGNSMFIHADNFTNANIKELMQFHINTTIPKKKLLTMMTFKTDNPSSCGIVRVNKEGIVEKFYEKDKDEHGNIANAAIYCFDDNLIKYLLSKKESFYDFSKDVIPNLLGEIQTYHTKSLLIDIGTLESLEKARNQV